MAENTERSVLEILEEYLECDSDLNYMKSQAKDSTDRNRSDFNNSDIGYCEDKIDKLKEELLAKPLTVLVVYKNNAKEGYDMMDYEIETNRKLIQSGKLSEAEKEALISKNKVLETKRDRTGEEIDLLEDILYKLGYEEPEENNEMDDQSDDLDSQGYGSKTFHS